MRLLGRNLSRRDLIPVGAALLLPVPLVALNGYAAGLPDAVGRGLGSVVTLDARDGRNGIEASGRAAETGSATQRSGRGTLKITRSRGTGLAGLGVVPSGSAGTQTGRGANGEEPEQMHRGGGPGNRRRYGELRPVGRRGRQRPWLELVHDVDRLAEPLRDGRRTGDRYRRVCGTQWLDDRPRRRQRRR